MRFEERAWFFVEPDVQNWVSRSGLAADFLALVWSFFALPLLAGACLWLMTRAPDVYIRLRNALAISTVIALIGFWLYPVAAPSALPDSGVRDLALRGQPAMVGNSFAALPALQAGWLVAAGVATYVAARRRWWRWLIWGALALMLLAAIVTGQHLILDLLVGSLLTLMVLGIVWHQARFRAWWADWLVPDPNGPSMITALRRDRWALMTVLSLAALTVYLSIGRALQPGFTDYWFYMMVQIVGTIAAVIWLTHRFGPENGLHPITLFIVVLVTYLDTLGTAADFYARYDFYDKITHTGGGAILAAAVYDLVASLRQRGAIRWRTSRQVSFAILISILLGSLWELYEFAGDAIFHTGRHSGRIDTLYDLISDSAGAILAVLLLAWVFQRSGPADPMVPGSGIGAGGRAPSERQESAGAERRGERLEMSDGSAAPRLRGGFEAGMRGQILRVPRIDRPAHSDRLLHCLLWCGALAPLVLGVTVLAGGWANPGYSHVRGTISDLWEQDRAHAEFVMTGLVLAGLLIILFGAGLHSAMPNHPTDVAVSFMAFGAAIIGSGLFQDYASRPGRALNLEGFLHNTWSWLAVGSLVLSMVVVLRHAARETPWHPLLSVSGATLLIVAVAAILFHAAPSGWRGACERLLFGAGCVWMLAVARVAAIRVERRDVHVGWTRQTAHKAMP
jgi:hypothetical membrane protein